MDYYFMKQKTATRKPGDFTVFCSREFLPAAGQMKMQIVPLVHDSFVIRL
jgi:hypothetical protein